MSQTLQNTPQRLALAVAAGLASFGMLTGLFVATMLVHYRAIDFAYLSFALLRIAAISTLVAAVASMSGRYLRSRAAAVLFGAVAGLIGGVAFVAAAA
ncbi:hypothetical protein H0E84_02535 [Luteimonas sp. SJ-92]|uniref:Uncharacterized protein n=1 Tax=Luteimonas salinisoli TaxID=2752307 RepID=A0A853J7W2_9GAMM|nr:hypothetical protein [Luteimonas salinisoli]NZA25246.1 hypothetical protein [Luteimonas salinisoli]